MQHSNKFYTLLQKLGVVRYSGKKNIYGLHPLVISALIIVITSLLANLLRKFFKLVLKENIFKALVFEFIATAELCACCFELIIVADNYGISAYAIFLFLLTLWWSSVWEDATACPYNHIENILEGVQSLPTALMLIISQVLGGLVIFHYVHIIWSIEFAETHIGRADEDCTADLAVPMEAGALIEGGATFLCRIISRTLSDINVRFGSIFDAFFATSLVVAAFNFSGGYFNPALATSLKFGCEGNSFEEHMVVYWLGATAGAIASVYFYKLPFVQKSLKQYGPKEE